MSRWLAATLIAASSSAWHAASAVEAEAPPLCCLVTMEQLQHRRPPLRTTLRVHARIVDTEVVAVGDGEPWVEIWQTYRVDRQAVGRVEAEAVRLQVVPPGWGLRWTPCGDDAPTSSPPSSKGWLQSTTRSALAFHPTHLRFQNGWREPELERAPPKRATKTETIPGIDLEPTPPPPRLDPEALERATPRLGTWQGAPIEVWVDGDTAVAVTVAGIAVGIDDAQRGGLTWDGEGPRPDASPSPWEDATLRSDHPVLRWEHGADFVDADGHLVGRVVAGHGRTALVWESTEPHIGEAARTANRWVAVPGLEARGAVGRVVPAR